MLNACVLQLLTDLPNAFAFEVLLILSIVSCSLVLLFALVAAICLLFIPHTSHFVQGQFLTLPFLISALALPGLLTSLQRSAPIP
ncbi:hypothetical protein BZA70DRAFT_275465 [Myxozyma melibiosi]|uniref:Uncharacterized protein n=1 Tax=Myxozyma melibiosi TaxID=54550 RepID=A0ABR1F836_9ASCO